MSKVADSEKGDESYPLKQIPKDEEKHSSKRSLNKEIDPATEKLVKEDNEKQTKGGFKSRLASSKYLSNPKVRSALLCLIILLVVIALGVIFLCLSMLDVDEWNEANVPRFLRIIPTPNQHKNLLRFNRGLSQRGVNWPSFVKEMDQFLDRYNYSKIYQDKKVTICTEKGPEGQDFCYYSVDSVLNHCKPEEKYGYPEGVPCVFIVINKILDWIPEKYLPDEIEAEDIPKDVRTKLQSGDLVLSCEGRTSFDKENLGKISYYPSQKIDPVYFPYKGQPDYLEPFIALKFESLQPNVALGISCRLWVKNLNETSTPSPFLPFHLLVD